MKISLDGPLHVSPPYLEVVVRDLRSRHTVLASGCLHDGVSFVLDDGCVGPATGTGTQALDVVCPSKRHAARDERKIKEELGIFFGD